MAQTGKNKLRRWEFPAGSGIRIGELINRSDGQDFGVSYRVTIPARIAGVRQFKQFASLEDAEGWAKQQHQGSKASGQKHFSLSPTEREDAISALALLKGSGLNLTQAATLAKKHVRAPSGNVTVRKIIDQMIAEKESGNLRDRSVRDLRNRLDIFAQTFGERTAAEITQAEIESWLKELRGISERSVAGLSPRSRKNYLITVRTFFTWAINRGFRSAENPATSIATPKIDWEAPSILTVAEAEKLLRAAKKEQDGRLLGPVVLGLFAGIRSNEIMRLDWSAVDLAEGIVTIGSQIAKKRRLRVIELMPNCIAWLKTISKREGRIAPGKYGVRWTQFVKDAGFPDWGENRSNAMRHSFGSYHYALYSDAAKTSAMLGHKANDQVLFDSYRSLARKKDGEAYFGILP